MSDAESKVRAVWERVEVEHGGHYIYLWPNEDPECCAVWHSWESALAFTEQRMREIAQAKEGLSLLVNWGNEGFDAKWMVVAFNSILAREKEHLAGLKRGMKAEATQ